jgi:hypothetical protein
MRIRTAAFAVVVAATVPLLSAASAGAAGAVSVTEHLKTR